MPKWHKTSNARPKPLNGLRRQSEMRVMKTLRVLIAKPGLDGHELGAMVVARGLRDAGMEVIYSGPRQTPEMIVDAAIQEDVDVIGLSVLSGAHKEYGREVLDLLEQRNATDIRLIVGGI